MGGELAVVEKPATSAAMRAEDQLAVVKTSKVSRTQRLDSTSSFGKEKPTAAVNPVVPPTLKEPDAKVT